MAQRDDALAAAAAWSDGDDDEPVRKRQAVAVVKATPNSGNTASLLSEPSWSDDAVSALLQATQAVDSAPKGDAPAGEVQTLPEVHVSADWPAAAAMPPLKAVLARVPPTQPAALDMSDALLSRAVSKLATTTTHPQCGGLIPAACLAAMSPPAAAVDKGVAGSLLLFDDDDVVEVAVPASGGAVAATASRKHGRHGDLFEDSDRSDSDDPLAVPPPPVVHIAQAGPRATPKAATASVPTRPEGALASRLSAQHGEFAAIAGCLAKQRAEVAHADKFLTWMCAALSAVAA